MLIPRGNVVHENLSTAFTHIDQLVSGLQDQRFTGCCHVSFWEYDGMLFFDVGRILSGREERGMRAEQVIIGDTAVKNILNKGQEKDGEISVYKLSEEMITILVASLDARPKYEGLSTDLTTLEKVIALVKKEALSGYIDVALEDDAGIANLFSVEGDIVETLLAPPDNQMIAESVHVKDVLDLCQRHGAAFNIYQSHLLPPPRERDDNAHEAIPQVALHLFEAILTQLEFQTDKLAKKGTFQLAFKKVLPKTADTYEFLDPFLGDFRYVNQTLTYHGEASYPQFVDGMCAVIENTLNGLFATIPKTTLLPHLSRALETVTMRYSTLIEQLNLETRLPEIFQDYSFSRDIRETDNTVSKGMESRSVLNLQGIGVSDIGSDNILREFYRVMTMIVEKFVDADGSAIRYSSLKKSLDFQRYQTATAFLQKLELEYLQSQAERLAFWLNLYNFLVIDGVNEFSIHKSVQDRKGFFSRTSYRIGEYLFSLDDIQHGILRNNQRKPYALLNQFSASDPRRQFCLGPADLRLHCCFVNGAKSAPSLTVYAPETLEQQLNAAVTGFLKSEKGLRFDHKANELWINRVLYWYRKDFDRKSETLLDFILKSLDDSKLKDALLEHRSSLTLRFMEYDWSLNGK